MCLGDKAAVCACVCACVVDVACCWLLRVCCSDIFWPLICVTVWQISLAGLDDKACKSAEQEVQIMLNLQHPNIVNYIGSSMDKASEVTYIV